MTTDDVNARLAACTAEERALLVVLAIAGEPMGRQRILEHMRALGVALPIAQWVDELARLRERKLVVEMGERGAAIAPELSWPVLAMAPPLPAPDRTRRCGRSPGRRSGAWTSRCEPTAWASCSPSSRS